LIVAKGEGVLRVGTRGSDLARWQAAVVSEAIKRLPGSPVVEEVIIKTEGDRITDIPLSLIEGKAFFTKEIEEALLTGGVDLAVHSLKDLATDMPAGLVIGAVLEREDPRDVLISRDGSDLDHLPAGAGVGTSSLRRRALVARWRNDLVLRELRGNVPTRIRKVTDGDYDSIILAAAGVKRLGMQEHISAFLPLEKFPPAVSQGAMAVQVRAGDEYTMSLVNHLDHPATRMATEAERALLRRIEGGCQIPVGALATVKDDMLNLRATLCSLDGGQAVDRECSGPAEMAEELGDKLAEEMLRDGADEILAEIRGAEGRDQS
jgi:hydroxymethylbilane synthase